MLYTVGNIYCGCILWVTHVISCGQQTDIVLPTGYTHWICTQDRHPQDIVCCTQYIECYPQYPGVYTHRICSKQDMVLLPTLYIYSSIHVVHMYSYSYYVLCSYFLINILCIFIFFVYLLR